MYASTTWAPFQSQWAMEKREFLERFDATEPTPENFHSTITKYAEIANQISLQNDDDSRLTIRYVQLNVTALKGSTIRHIDEWQRLHMELLAKRSFKKLDLIYKQMESMSKDIDVQPTNRLEMMKTLKLHERIVHEEIPRLEKEFSDARNHFRVMGKRGGTEILCICFLTRRFHYRSAQHHSSSRVREETKGSGWGVGTVPGQVEGGRRNSSDVQGSIRMRLQIKSAPEIQCFLKYKS